MLTFLMLKLTIFLALVSALSLELLSVRQLFDGQLNVSLIYGFDAWTTRVRVTSRAEC